MTCNTPCAPAWRSCAGATPIWRCSRADDLARAAELALLRDGGAALSYGADQGPGRLIAQLCAWLTQHEARPVAPERLFIAGGLSQGLDLLCTLYTRPGDAILVDAPTYHLALRVFRDHGLELIAVAGDEDGLRPDALAEALAELRRAGRRARFLYLVPNFGNPTGATLPLARRQEIAAPGARRRSDHPGRRCLSSPLVRRPAAATHSRSGSRNVRSGSARSASCWRRGCASAGWLRRRRSCSGAPTVG